MSPKNTTADDPVLVRLARIEERLIGIADKQRDQALKIRWMMAVAMGVVGLIGGPDAVAALSGTSA